MKIDLKKIKNSNDVFIENKYGKKFDFLPTLELIKINIKGELEIKRRAVILSVIVQASFEKISIWDAEGYLTYHNLYDFLTEGEKIFLQKPTKNKMIYETWKSECLYALLWSLGVNVDILNVTDLADLNKISSEYYPFTSLNESPEYFINNNNLKRREIFNLVEVLDFYSRLDYICDSDVLNLKETTINTALVYERRYALIWLLTDVSWDSVSCNSIY